MTFSGRHYETGTIANALAAAGIVNPKTRSPYSEALAFGASGGSAFGYFVFEYKGESPHVAILPRNTFSPFERALDNLAIIRDTRETTDPDRAEKNLIKELDAGQPVIVWADVFSLPHRGLGPVNYWAMQPMLVIGMDGDDFLIADGSDVVSRVSAPDLKLARAKVKKDRNRTTILERVDGAGLGAGLNRGIETCAALYLDKPPAGSVDNFGVAGLRNWANLLENQKSGKGWAKQFAPGPALAQALVGGACYFGVWEWIETWGTCGGADRATQAAFLREAADWTGRPALLEAAEHFEASGPLWTQLADAAMPASVPTIQEIKRLKLESRRLWREEGWTTAEARRSARARVLELIPEVAASAELAASAVGMRSEIADLVRRIADIEEAAAHAMRR